MDMCHYTLLSKKDTLLFLKSQKLCQLGTMSCKELEIVPMWYVFSYDGKILTFYFITLPTGEKTNNMHHTGTVCVTLNKTETRCKKEHYTSIVANGKATIISDDSEIAHIIKKFKRKYGSNHAIFNSCNDQTFKFIKVGVTEISGKSY
ncbi:MAG: pyridoxamine 5'-phosphate oxidase family protein [Turicibacter sp.]